MTIRAVVFDFDGLICDTESHDLAAWQEVFRDHGVELPLDWWLTIVGRADHRHPSDLLEELLGRAIDRDVVRAAKRRRFRALCAATMPLPGVVDWLDEAHVMGLAVGLASSSDRPYIVEHLDRLGLADRFAVVRTRDDVARAKPWPDVYLAACEGLGVEPGDAVAVEDSPNGTRAAKSAGMRCVAVPSPVTRALDFSHADIVLASLADIGLAALLRRLDIPSP